MLSDKERKLYDRQLGEYGMDAMLKLRQLDVLIIGVRGLGCEIAKNVILAGPRSVTVADAGTVALNDLSAHFYLREEHVGTMSRAEAAVDSLKELNPFVTVEAHESAISPSFMSKFAVVVMTNSSPEERMCVNEHCRTQQPPIRFIAAEIHGLAGFMFVDFGPGGHVSFDADGEKPRMAVMSIAENSNPCTITLDDEFPYALSDGDLVHISEVRGMEELNQDKRDGTPLKVTVINKSAISVNVDASSFGVYKGGGVIRQVKPPTEVKHRSLEECIPDPGELMMIDTAKFLRPLELHRAFQGLHGFQELHGGALPEARTKAHEDEVVDYTLRFTTATGGSVEDVDETIPRLLAAHARVELSPMASVMGSIAAQEVIKSMGKYMPFNQYLYFDALECLPSEPVPEEDTQGVGSRVDPQVLVFGREMQQKLAAQNLFLVGAGALGCEMLKGLAMMGVATGNEGKVTVTDMDYIETSNLNRQFLFRPQHIGKSKSVVAGEMVREMCADINVAPLEVRVGKDTEDIFTEPFWDELDVVVNALDNVPARLYVDGKCVEHQKPLLESGTLGTKGSTQVILPGITESYGSQRDPDEKETPFCTTHLFPYLPEHCIQLARDLFSSLFDNPLENLQAYSNQGVAFFEAMPKMHDRAEAAQAVLDLHSARGSTFAACVQWARHKFDTLFDHDIKQMLHVLPPDHTDEFGNPFWVGTRRLPAPITFDAEDPVHCAFVMAAANIRAFNLGLPPNNNEDAIKALLAVTSPKEFAVKSGVAYSTDKTKSDGMTSTEDETAYQRCVEELPLNIDVGNLQAAVFEKDDDTNFHIDFIWRCASLRAQCYTIPEFDRHKAKMVAGSIIPALATTTALMTGLILLELYKIVQGHDVERFRNVYLNLGIPMILHSEPFLACKKQSPGPRGELFQPDGHTLWDRLVVPKPNPTFKQLDTWFKKEHKLKVAQVHAGDKALFMDFLPSAEEKLEMKVSSVYSSVVGVPVPIAECQTRIVVSVICETTKGDTVFVPATHISIKKKGKKKKGKKGKAGQAEEEAEAAVNTGVKEEEVVGEQESVAS